jgi:hypothetical protein
VRPSKGQPAGAGTRSAHGTRQVRFPGALPGVEDEEESSAEVGAHEGVDSRGWGTTRARALALGANTPWWRTP